MWCVCATRWVRGRGLTQEGCFGEEQQAEQAVDVREASVTSLRFEETGFLATVVSPVPLHAESLSQEGQEMLEFPAGESRRCLQAPQYQLALRGCAEVASPVVLSAASHRLEVTPSAYFVEGSIALSAGVGVDVSDWEASHSQVRVAAEQNGRVVSEVTAVKDGERFLYHLVGFPPPSHADAGPRRVLAALLGAQHTVPLPSRRSSPRGEETLKPVAAAEGRVVSGQIVPPLAGVVVRMTLEGAAPLEATSDAKGVYVFPAIDPATHFISFVAMRRSLNATRWRL